MTIDETIKILNDILDFVSPGDPPEEHDAIQLGIEALKLVKEKRRYPEYIIPRLLPGETKEKVKRR